MLWRLIGQIPTLFVVPKEGQDITAKEIRNFCRQSLANYKLPHKIEFIDSIPKTGSGKIDRSSSKKERQSRNEAKIWAPEIFLKG